MQRGLAVEQRHIAIDEMSLDDVSDLQILRRALAIADCKPIVDEAFVKIGEATA